MQNAKDTFYGMLRGRIASGNGDRTVVVRGVTRPGVLVEENELPSATRPAETFVLQWPEVDVQGQGALPMARMTCAIRYETAGSDASAGMDRGRRLAAMDAELMQALMTVPLSAVKSDVSVTHAGTLGTRVFWSAPALGPIESTEERLGRTARVLVYSYEEANEQ